jgi:uncharacterized protein (TIGR02001 family)
MKLSIGAVVLGAVLGGPLVAAAQEAELSANVGWVSEYHYRGILQKASSASGGLDLAVSKVYLGAWAADVGDGNEVDVYAGIGTEVDDLSVSIGGTGYFYTGGFDDTYLEGNLNAGYKAISGEFSYGQYKAAGGDQDYWFAAVTLEEAGVFATFGTFGKDFSGEYVEAGYGVSVGDLDLSASWIYATDDLITNSDHTLVFGISHTFGIDIN